MEYSLLHGHLQSPHISQTRFYPDLVYQGHQFKPLHGPCHHLLLFLQGEEVFNTYGELANWHLLHMYGFAERYPSNHWDTVSQKCVMDCFWH